MFAVSYGRCLEEKDSVCESQHVVPDGPGSVEVEVHGPLGDGLECHRLDLVELLCYSG